VIPQSELSTERLAGIVSKAMHDPSGMAAMAANARKAGKPDAARLLALMVEAIAGGRTIAQFKGERP
jgi:UDP-N-acetylglucosamine--N-acetylmuramyl-(pentapeptide) pyrophosphoryl-undecaprenol N-acetylglucosamine transferase